MKIATTTEDFAPYFEKYTDCIENVAKAGFKYIDLSMYIVHDNDPLLLSENWRYTVEDIKKCTERLGVMLVQAHSPGGNIFTEEHSINQSIFDMNIRSIEVCAELGIPNIVVHPGFWTGITKEEAFFYNKEFYTKLLKETEKLGVNILVENSPIENLSIGYFFTTGKEMSEFIKEVNHPLFHACWDTGHANTLGEQYQHIQDLKNDLFALHVNDNRGSQDEHIMPYLGTLSLDDLINGLIDSEYKGYFTFEACRLLRPDKIWFGNRHSFPKDKRLANPTLSMHSTMEKLMYEIGKYALSAYNIFEE